MASSRALDGRADPERSAASFAARNSGADAGRRKSRAAGSPGCSPRMPRSALACRTATGPLLAAGVRPARESPALAGRHALVLGGRSEVGLLDEVGPARRGRRSRPASVSARAISPPESAPKPLASMASLKGSHTQSRAHTGRQQASERAAQCGQPDPKPRTGRSGSTGGLGSRHSQAAGVAAALLPPRQRGRGGGGGRRHRPRSERAAS